MIRLAKIYPNNVEQVAPVGARQQLALNLYRDPTDGEQRKEDLEEALKEVKSAARSILSGSCCSAFGR